MSVGTYALTTRKAVEAYRILDGKVANQSPETGDLIDTLIDTYTSMFESFTGRLLKSRVHTEYHDGEGCGVLFPEEYPITSVSGIWNDAEWQFDSSSLVDSDTYDIVDTMSIYKRTGYFASGPNSVKIIYTGGFITVPSDLEHACVTEINKFIDRIHEGGLTYKLSGDLAISLSEDALLPQTRLVLNKYRKKVVL